MLDGVPVLTGPMVGDWIRSLTIDVLDPAAIDGVWRSIGA